MDNNKSNISCDECKKLMNCPRDYVPIDLRKEMAKEMGCSDYKFASERKFASKRKK